MYVYILLIISQLFTFMVFRTKHRLWSHRLRETTLWVMGHLVGHRTNHRQ